MVLRYPPPSGQLPTEIEIIDRAEPGNHRIDEDCNRERDH